MALANHSCSAWREAAVGASGKGEVEAVVGADLALRMLVRPRFATGASVNGLACRLRPLDRLEFELVSPDGEAAMLTSGSSTAKSLAVFEAGVATVLIEWPRRVGEWHGEPKGVTGGEGIGEEVVLGSVATDRNNAMGTVVAEGWAGDMLGAAAADCVDETGAVDVGAEELVSGAPECDAMLDTLATDSREEWGVMGWDMVRGTTVADAMDVVGAGTT